MATTRRSRQVTGQLPMFTESTAATQSHPEWRLTPLQRWTGKAGVAAARAALEDAKQRAA